jgi:hypothetical protein
MASRTYSLPSGASIEVQSVHASVGAKGVEQASALEDKAGQAWTEAMDKVAELAEAAVAKLKKATKSCKEVEIEFGVSIGGKTGLILVEGTLEANLKVVLKW